MRVNGGRDAQRTDDERDEANERQEAFAAIEAARNERMGLAIIGYQPARECSFEALAGFGDVGRTGIEPEQLALRGAAAELQ
jgi:hypothetical protein